MKRKRRRVENFKIKITPRVSIGMRNDGLPAAVFVDDKQLEYARVVSQDIQNDMFEEKSVQRVLIELVVTSYFRSKQSKQYRIRLGCRKRGLTSKPPKYFVLRGRYEIKLSAESAELAVDKLADAINGVFTAAYFSNEVVEEAKPIFFIGVRKKCR